MLPTPPTPPVGGSLMAEAAVAAAVAAAAAAGANIQTPAFPEALGIILPPAEIRGIIDKTAQFVAKNGPEFEQRVLIDKGADPKFSFLLPGNPYRPFYDAKLREFKTGEVTEAAVPQIPQAILDMRRREVERKEKKEKLLALTCYATEPLFPGTAVGDNLLKLTDGSISMPPDGRPSGFLAIDDGRPPEPPSEDLFTCPKPFAAAFDVDVIRLTAQYVARNGQKFLVGLGQRERGNSQFAFLRATHPLFAYFTTLVDAYTRCLQPDKAILARLKEDTGVAGRFTASVPVAAAAIAAATAAAPVGTDPQTTAAMLGVLERVAGRHRWEVYEEKKKQEKMREQAEEREQMHALDWHEFMVVEVINFTEEDDMLALGAPIDIATLTTPEVIPQLAPQSADMLTADLREAIGAEAFAPMVIEAPGLQQQASTSPEAQHMKTIPVEMTVPPSLMSTAPLTTQLQGGFSDGPPEAPTPAIAPIVVVQNYVRQPKKRLREGMMRCPLTSVWVAAEKMSDHLRILLLDPKWKEQKDILLEKAQKESAFAPESDFEANLANFVVKRPDLFGTVDDECESSYVPGPKRK